jgi:hypothetical protein
VHEFILPAGYTVDQVKVGCLLFFVLNPPKEAFCRLLPGGSSLQRAIFKQIPDLAKETNPNDYQLKLRDTLRSKALLPLPSSSSSLVFRSLLVPGRTPCVVHAAPLFLYVSPSSWPCPPLNTLMIMSSSCW